jgi:light-regulated signal transduction histidine kinase (bacteriophytochrome)
MKEQIERFASITLHHLREPVRMVAAYTQLLEEAWTGSTDDVTAKCLAQLQDAAARMQALLEGLAEFASAGKDPRLAPVRIDLILRHAMQSVDGEIRESGAKVELPDDLPKLMGDFDQLSLLFRHLLQNAIRYRGEDPPLIRISAKRQNDEWVISVADNGPGIEPQYAERVFGPYVRLHDQSHPGNGLGLAICKAIAESHAGRIWVETDVAPGSTVCIALPAASEVASAAG